MKKEFHKFNWLKHMPEGEEEGPQIVVVLRFLVCQFLDQDLEGGGLNSGLSANHLADHHDLILFIGDNCVSL